MRSKKPRERIARKYEEEIRLSLLGRQGGEEKGKRALRGELPKNFKGIFFRWIAITYVCIVALRYTDIFTSRERFYSNGKVRFFFRSIFRKSDCF